MAASSFFLLPMLNCCLWQWEGFYSQRPQLVRLPFIVLLLGCGAERKHCHQHHHPPPLPPLCLCSLLVLKAIIFIWKPIRGNKEKREWESDGEGRVGTQRDRVEQGRKTVILLKLWSMLPACVCTLPAKMRALLICSHISKKWVLNPRFPSVLLWITSLLLNKAWNAKHQS